MQILEIEELFRLAFEAGEAYGSLIWDENTRTFAEWYEQHKEEILSTINKQTKCKNS